MNSELKNLIDKHLRNSLTPEETTRLQQMLQNREYLDSMEEMVPAQLQVERPEESGDAAMRSTILAGLDEKIDLLESSRKADTIPMRQRRTARWKMLAAASVLLFVLAGGWFRYHHATPVPTQLVTTGPAAPAKKIVPGSNKATLTLADGSEITLDDSNKGDIAVQGGIKVVKMDNGVIAYNGKNAGSANMFNTIRTPRGGQYEWFCPTAPTPGSTPPRPSGIPRLSQDPDAK
ncbi:hypothetical protein ACQ86N_00325 [Puia sp. P3]|uniref:hypothetical protein n=1 Tax=Puia sp. P3 TaxID=3423952 RepID=UPI003D67FEBF